MTPVTARTASDPDGIPVGLGARGRRLWVDLVAAGRPGPAHLVLLEEACRIADRLDRLDRALADSQDGAWLRFRTNDDGSEVTVFVDRALSEARQQAATLKQLVAELRQAARPVKSAGTGQRKGAAGVADLSARIAARRGPATG